MSNITNPIENKAIIPVLEELIQETAVTIDQRQQKIKETAEKITQITKFIYELDAEIQPLQNKVTMKAQKFLLIRKVYDLLDTLKKILNKKFVSESDQLSCLITTREENYSKLYSCQDLNETNQESLKHLERTKKAYEEKLSSIIYWKKSILRTNQFIKSQIKKLTQHHDTISNSINMSHSTKSVKQSPKIDNKRLFQQLEAITTAIEQLAHMQVLNQETARLLHYNPTQNLQLPLRSYIFNEEEKLFKVVSFKIECEKIKYDVGELSQSPIYYLLTTKINNSSEIKPIEDDEKKTLMAKFTQLLSSKVSTFQELFKKMP